MATISGTAGDDMLAGGTGDDLFHGYSGDDVYHIGMGDGRDTITEADGNDTIVFGAGLTRGEMALYRGDNDDLYLQFRSTGQQVRIVNHFAPGGAGQVEQAIFADGQVVDLTAAGIGLIAHGNGAHTAWDANHSYLTANPADEVMRGGANADILNGEQGNDFIHGDAGNDVIDGGYGSDTLWGDAGDDRIEGGIGTDWLMGGTGNDTLIGGTGLDKLEGGDGDDILEGGFNDDTLIGGAGNNIYRVDRRDGRDTIIASGSSDIIEIGEGLNPEDMRFYRNGTNDLYIQFRDTDQEIRVIGHFAGAASQVDLIRFANGCEVDVSPDVIALRTIGSDNGDFGLAGAAYTSVDETIQGSASCDLIWGRAGNNKISGLEGNDELHGGKDQDQIHGGDGDDLLNGEAGSDYLSGGTGDDLLRGGAGNDRLDGGDGCDILDGGTGEDTLAGGAGENVYRIAHGDGGDNVTMTGSRDIIEFGEGLNATDLRYVRTNTNDLNLYFPNSQQVVRIVGYFASSFQQTVLARFADGSEIDLTNKAMTLSSLAITYNQVRNLTGGAGNDTLEGFGAADILNGGDGDDALRGEGGADKLTGGQGADLLVGGTGDDTLIGGEGANVYRIEQGDGVDRITATSGQDIIEFGAGLDLDDMEFYRAANDDLMLRWRSTSQIVIITNHFAGAANQVQVARFADCRQIDLTSEQLSIDTGGADYNDNAAAGNHYNSNNLPDENLWGTGNGDVLRGYGGNDFIKGLGGDDVIEGNLNNDTLWGGEGNDWLDGGHGMDWLMGEGGDDVLIGGDDNDKLEGGAGNDVLRGGIGYDILYGGDGDDVLDGGVNGDVNDILNGGAGSDTYILDHGGVGDSIVNSDASTSSTDTLLAGPDIRADQLWFSRIGDTLRVSIIGTLDHADIQNWYLGGANQLDVIKAGDGQVLMAAQVEQLRSAMAAFTAPPAGQFELTAQQHAALDPVLAASWT